MRVRSFFSVKKAEKGGKMQSQGHKQQTFNLHGCVFVKGTNSYYRIRHQTRLCRSAGLRPRHTNVPCAKPLTAIGAY